MAFLFPAGPVNNSVHNTPVFSEIFLEVRVQDVHVGSSAIINKRVNAVVFEVVEGVVFPDAFGAEGVVGRDPSKGRDSGDDCGGQE